MLLRGAAESQSGVFVEGGKRGVVLWNAKGSCVKGERRAQSAGWMRVMANPNTRRRQCRILITQYLQVYFSHLNCVP